MVLEIVKYGHPALRQKGAVVKEVDDKIRQLAIDMLETMDAANGVGLAAQQVGVPIQMAVIDVAGVEDRPSTMTINGKEVNPDEQMPLVLLNPGGTNHWLILKLVGVQSNRDGAGAKVRVGKQTAYATTSGAMPRSPARRKFADSTAPTLISRPASRGSTCCP